MCVLVNPTVHNFLTHSPGLYEKIKRDTHLVDVDYTWIKDAIVLKYMIRDL